MTIKLARSTFIILVVTLWFSVSSVVRASVIPLGDIATETVSELNYGGLSNEFSWFGGYDIGFTQSTNLFNIGINIVLLGDEPGNSLIDTWEQGIESIWSGQYQIAQDGTYFYDVMFDVEFYRVSDIPTDTTIHHAVTVHEGSGSVDLYNWFTSNPSGWSGDKQDELAAHEVGHLFGNYDEYAGSGAAVNPDGSFGSVYDSIMGSGLTDTVHERHYEFISDWVTGKTGYEDFDVIATGFAPSAPSVPLPGAFYLLVSGLFALIGIGRRHNRKVLIAA